MRTVTEFNYSVKAMANQTKRGLLICRYKDPEFLDVLLQVQKLYNSKSIDCDIKSLLINPRNVKRSDIT